MLVLTLVVRDEEDVIAANLDYHLAQGVDMVLVIDHGSTDGTTEILNGYERTGQVRSFRDEAPAHDQARRVNRLLAIAAKDLSADWVIHGDADEFWMPTVGSLPDVFGAVPDRYGYVSVRRHNFLPAPDTGELFHQRMVVRHSRSLNLRFEVLQPKVAQRPVAAAEVTPGNHELVDPALEPAPDVGMLEVLHFPLRTYEQFERKVIKVGVGYERLEDRPPLAGHDQLELLAIQRRGELRGYYEAEALDAGRIEDGLRRGELVIDRRLADFMRTGPTALARSAAVTQLVRHTWEPGERIVDAEHARAGAERRSAELSAELERTRVQSAAAIAQLQIQLQHARAEASALRSGLAAVRESRIMRYSAPIRRRYYRWRGIA